MRSGDPWRELSAADYYRYVGRWLPPIRDVREQATTSTVSSILCLALMAKRPLRGATIGAKVMTKESRMNESAGNEAAANSAPDWKHHGVRVIKGDQLDPNTAQTAGMQRAAAINHARVGAQKIWAGTVRISPNAKTGAHHHGALESVIYVVRGRARMRWGERLEYVAEAVAGDFIFVPPYVPHQEINRSTSEALECVLVRSDNEAVVVNLDIAAVERPEAVYWVDPIHAPPERG